MEFIEDRRGRVPFAVLGVFLLVGSAVTSGIITGLEREHAREIPITLKAESVNYLIKYAEADISRALTYSCLEALKKVGESPVTYSNLSSEAAKDYSDENGDGRPDEDIVGENGIVDTFDESVKFNKNWARNMVRVNFNRYLNATFTHNIYQDNDYAINVFDPENNGAIDDWRDIEFDDIEMELERAVYVKSLVSEDKNVYPAYWKASVKNLEIEICNLSSGENFLHSINVSCLIPSRLPLLMELTETYHSSINGISPLMGLVTVIGEGCTEVRALLQYAGKYNWISNIVDDRWIQYLTNVGLIAIQYSVFNSVDPMELVHLALNINDLISKSNITDADRYVSNNAEDEIKNKILGTLSLPIDYREYRFRTFGNGTDKKAEKELGSIIGSQHMEKGYASVYNLSRDILNETSVTYYYFNESANPKMLLEDRWMGYSFTRNGYRYHLSTGHGDTGNAALQKIFVKKYLPKTNSTILQKISDEIRKEYSVGFTTYMNKTKINESYSNSFLGEWKGPVSCGKWNLVRSVPEGNILLDGELPLSVPRYKETWKLEWERKEIWEHKECHIEHIGNDTMEACSWIPYNITHYYTEEVNFSLIISDYPEHVQDIFCHKKVFGNPPHKRHEDDNMEFLLRKYVNNYFTNWRDYYTDTSKDAGIGENMTFPHIRWENNVADGDETGYDKIKWVTDECVAALYNITKMIKEDSNKYGNISDHFNNTAVNLSLIDMERDLVVKEFEDNRGRYLDEGYYMEGGEYKSVAAKVILEIRKWFLDEIEKKLNASYAGVAREEIDEQLRSYSAGAFKSYQDYEDAIDEYKNSISQLTDIQFGNQMKLKKGWEENVTLTISTDPDYFDFNNPPSREEDWRFDVKNICLFGPTGLPLLPTPVTPWIVTINSWYIHVDGHWDTFKVIDSSDETHPDPLFGHIGQTYTRERKIVFDTVCYPEDSPEIGQCRRLNFEFDTMSLAIVPSGRLPIGDLDGIVESDSVGN